MKKNFLYLCAMIFTLALTSCSKEEYGNTTTETNTYNSGSWVFNDPSYYTDINVAAINQDVLDNGAVLVYVSINGSPYSQLPLTFFTSADYSSTLEVQHSLGLVRVLWTDSDLIEPNMPPAMTFKIVVMSQSQIITNPNLDTTNYKEVAEALNL
ncbi:hypothetical protein OAL39_01745 [bacterium]|nr:hypothetical protein [bacterium]